MNNAFFSRERAAGYRPEVLGNQCVLIVGTGALGQNVAMNLAMSQLGALLLVDSDQWEIHNATRSALFPTPGERKRWGPDKSGVVAHKLAQMISWSSLPRFFYATKPIQMLGDVPFRKASAIVSGVDNHRGRDYLGLKAAQFHVPLVEGGFRGSRTNCTILLNDRAQAPCWHCNIYDRAHRNTAVQLGCTRVAREAEQAGFVPAIQTAAAYLGAFMSEAAIQLLHGHRQLGDTQVFMDIRTATSRTARLQFNPKCPLHPDGRKVGFRLHLPPHASCGDLVEELESRMARPVVRLPLSFLVRVGCAQCKHPISIRESDWIMASLLFCSECGGAWPRTDKPGNEIYTTLSADTEPLLGLSLEQVGLVPGSVVEADSDGATVAFELEADSEFPFFSEAKENRDVVQNVS